MNHNKTYLNIHGIILLGLVSLVIGCKKFITVDAPSTSTNAENIYATDATAISVLTGIYAKMSFVDCEGSLQDGITGLNLYPGLSADEIQLYEASINQVWVDYYQNTLSSLRTSNSDFWNSFYSFLFTVNSGIEGLNKSTNLTGSVKSQLLGEAFFLRAFAYFYLVNLYGDVPLVLTTDYSVSSLLGRASTIEVYNQIKQDLIQAQSLLNDNYRDATLLNITIDRVRPNKATATALLARVYLFTADYENAEKEATKIISNTALYDTVPLNDVFLKNSKETLWSLQSVNTDVKSNTGSGRRFILPETGPSEQLNPFYLSPALVESFDQSDLRLSSWINSVHVTGTTYDYPYKYKIGSVLIDNQENTIIFRLAEQFLIRAEARAQLANLVGENSAKSDIDFIRLRAGLPEITATSKEEILKSVLLERRHELFTEWGHRWLDLKRTSTIDAIMAEAAVLKSSTWDSRWALYPIPSQVVLRSPTIEQNKGY